MTDKIETLIQQGLQARRENRPADAKRDFTEAVTLCRQAALPNELARALTGLGQIERDMHSNQAALAHYEEAVAIYRKQKNPLKLAHTIRHVADIQRHERLHESAHANYSEALALYRAHPETPPLDLANTLRGFALLKEEMADAPQARTLWREARDLDAAANVEAGVAEATRKVSML